MASHSKLIEYILLIINHFYPKNEEFIHSCLFIINKQDKELMINDWYSNGYGILSETVSNAIKSLCEKNLVTYSGRGYVTMVKDIQFTTEMKQRVNELIHDGNFNQNKIIDKAITIYNSSFIK